MAAEKLDPNRVRLCECGCGASIAHMFAHAKRLPLCAKRDAMKRQSERRRMGAVMTRTKRMDRLVYRAPGEKRPAHVVQCDRCADIPSARTPLRRVTVNAYSDAPVGVARNGRWECTECGQPWAPDPPLPRTQPVIRSSSGMAIDRARIYGDEFLGKPKVYKKRKP